MNEVKRLVMLHLLIHLGLFMKFVKTFKKLIRRFTLKTINYKELTTNDIDLSLFSSFDRHQEVEKCWRKENDEWILKDISFTEKWGLVEYQNLVYYLKNTIKTGGYVFGAFEEKRLVGFASIENEFFGSEKEYLQLSSIHITNGNRGNGIGKQLFHLVCDSARKTGAKKLYISAHSSKESKAFYDALGCVEATEYNAELVEMEPCDCQLEYLL